jgi:hypothetical protein
VSIPVDIVCRDGDLMRDKLQHPTRFFLPRESICVALLAIAQMLSLGACSSSSQKGFSVSKREFIAPNAKLKKEDAEIAYPRKETASPVSQLLERHQTELMAIDGVEGVGVGQDRIGNEAIVIYVKHNDVAKNVPQQIEGVPVQVEVTGPIDAL